MPLVALRMFRNRTANLGLGTQIIQWLTLQGCFFVISVFLQQERGYSAIKTGLVLTPATRESCSPPLWRSGSPGGTRSAGSSGSASRSRRSAWRCCSPSSGRIPPTSRPAPGLLLMGIGVGGMLDLVRVKRRPVGLPRARSGSDISGVSRSVSNLGSSLGTALAGSIIASTLLPGNKTFALSLVLMLVITLGGLLIAMSSLPVSRPWRRLPRRRLLYAGPAAAPAPGRPGPGPRPGPTKEHAERSAPGPSGTSR